MRIAVVGLGKLGAPLAAVLASKGHDVLGIDVDSETVRLVGAGRAPVAEPGLQDLLTASAGRLTATTDVRRAAEAELTVLLVPTPSDERGAFSNTFLLDVIDELGRGLAECDGYHVVTVASTVMPGACVSELQPALERASQRRVGDSLGLCYSPEFIALGSVVRDLLEPDMVLIGESDASAGALLERLYAGVCENDPPFRHMSLVNAELTKIAVNAYVTMKISYANTLADMCERLPDADVDTVTDALGLDTRIGPRFLRGALAFGGPCFPRDNTAFGVLARDLGTDAPLADATDAVNEAQTERLMRIVRAHLAADGAVGILGLSYKPGTGVVDESPGVVLAAGLARDGVEEINVFDPVAGDAALGSLDAIRACGSVGEVLERSDVVVITPPGKEFARLPLDVLERTGRRPVVIDCWRVLEDGHADAVDVVLLGRPLEARLCATRYENRRS